MIHTLFIITYVILVCFAFTSTLGLVSDTNVFSTKYYAFLIVIYGIMILTPILNIIPIVVYLILINKKS